jgi:hypothetical protein
MIPTKPVIEVCCQSSIFDALTEIVFQGTILCEIYNLFETALCNHSTGNINLLGEFINSVGFHRLNTNSNHDLRHIPVYA